MSTALLTGFVDLTRGLGLNYSFLLDDFDRCAFLGGALTTLQIAAVTVVSSLLLAVLVLPLLRSRHSLLASALRASLELTRNTPTLVQLYCAFLVLNMLLTQLLQSHGLGNPLSPWLWGVLVLSVHKAAFHAEALRAGLEAVPRVTLEAAESLGFDRRATYWRIELPIALRFALPSLINNTIDLVKATAVVSAIAVSDITYASLMIWANRDNVLELMILILLYFGVLTWLVSRAGHWLEQRLRMPGYGH